MKQNLINECNESEIWLLLFSSQIAVLISAGFIGCWAPYGLVSLWSIVCDSSTIPPEVSLLPCMFAKSSTVYNPMIYYIFSQSFKREVKQMRAMCLGSSSYHVSNSINDNTIYMVKIKNSKPKIAARSTLQDITETKTVTLSWKTFWDRLPENGVLFEEDLWAGNCGNVSALVMTVVLGAQHTAT